MREKTPSTDHCPQSDLQTLGQHGLPMSDDVMPDGDRDPPARKLSTHVRSVEGVARRLLTLAFRDETHWI